MFCSLSFRQIMERIAVADFGSLKLRFIYFGEYSSWREERCGFGGECPNLSRHVALDFDILITKGDSCVWPYLILGEYVMDLSMRKDVVIYVHKRSGGRLLVG